VPALARRRPSARVTFFSAKWMRLRLRPRFLVLPKMLMVALGLALVAPAEVTELLTSARGSW